MDLTERLFLGVGLSDLVRGDIVGSLTGYPIPGLAVRPESWHLTLRFLGSCDLLTRERVTAAFDGSDRGGPVPITFRRLGAFPDQRRASVVWLGVERGAERLAQLAGICDEAAQAAGLPPEDRPFHPHLTLSRVRPPEDVTVLLGSDHPPPVRFRVDHVTLFRSHLGEGRAVYEPLERFDLG